MPRKGGPGVTASDLLVVNKTDLAPHVGVDAVLMKQQGEAVRDGRPVIALSRSNPESVAELRGWVLGMLAAHRAGGHVPVDPGPMAPHVHAGGHPHMHHDDHGRHEH